MRGHEIKVKYGDVRGEIKLGNDRKLTVSGDVLESRAAGRG